MFDEMLVQRQVRNQVESNPVFTAAHMIERDRAVFSINVNREFRSVQANRISTVFQLQRICPFGHLNSYAIQD